jgi:hypothetical protein
MNFNPNSRRRLSHAALLGAVVLALAACAKKAPMDLPPPPPPPPAPMAPPPPPPPPAPGSPPPPIYRVASGSPSVLARFPRGTQVTLQTQICLKAGEQVTVTGSNGQSVTYNRPGCLKRDARPTGENAGGFTFGWRAPEGRASTGRAK